MTDETNKNLIDEGSNILTLIKDKKYFSALKAFIKLSITNYRQHIKGKYVNVKGKRIPVALLLAVLLALGWFAIPSDDNDTQTNNQQEETVKKEALNTFEGNGVKVYGLSKCDNAVCGIMENIGQSNIARIVISMTFHDNVGNVIYEGGAEATSIVAQTRSRFKIPAEGEFEYFTLTDVLVEK